MQVQKKKHINKRKGKWHVHPQCVSGLYYYKPKVAFRVFLVRILNYFQNYIYHFRRILIFGSSFELGMHHFKNIVFL